MNNRRNNRRTYERPSSYTPTQRIQKGVQFWLSLSILWVLFSLAIWALLEFYFPHSATAGEGQLNLESSFQKPNYYAIGLEAGRCDADGNIIMCNRDQLVWHLYVRGEFPLTESGDLLWTITAEHYSSLEEEDFSSELGSGSYQGTGLEFRF